MCRVYALNLLLALKNQREFWESGSVISVKPRDRDVPGFRELFIQNQTGRCVLRPGGVGHVAPPPEEEVEREVGTRAGGVHPPAP